MILQMNKMLLFFLHNYKLYHINSGVLHSKVLHLLIMIKCFDGQILQPFY